MSSDDALHLTVNGEDETLPAGDASVAALVRHRGLDAPRGVAVAVEGEVVPRQDWGDRTLSDGQSVDIVTAQQGG